MVSCGSDVFTNDKKIAEAHHGFIEADGEEGGGAMFTLGFLKVEELPSTNKKGQQE